ncbi:hypothetical protein HY632_01520 [Candidatus Uhrbacteria bacterium]|nr:hypothetical protein [Candidatus Uhrbacteria bacterium]
MQITNPKYSGTLGLIVITVIGIALVRTRRTTETPVSATPDRVFCTADGTLADTPPIQSHRSYCMRSDTHIRTYLPGVPQMYAFSIIDDRGETLTEYAVTHTKPMHLIVVRTDLQHFQHLHPTFDAATGQWTLTDLMFSEDGTYRIYADFAPVQGTRDPHGAPIPITIAENISVGAGAAYSRVPLENEATTKTFDSYQVTLSANPLVANTDTPLTFRITQHGAPAKSLEEYLGARGHSVILRSETLDFLHTHPSATPHAPLDGIVDFRVTFPEAGRYKIFTQFKIAGRVITTDFVVSVSRADGRMQAQRPHANDDYRASYETMGNESAPNHSVPATH